MDTKFTHFPGSAYRVMPWKNGKGSTTEICIRPLGSTVQEGFDWRISLAQVPESGPFSTFPQHERIIMLLRGAPMQLVHEEHGEHILQPFQPYAFSGAWKTSGVLTGGPVEDFNVMIRSGYGRAQVRVYRGSENTEFQHPRADVQFIWAVQGSVQINAADPIKHLRENESCLIEDGPDTLLRLPSPETVVVTVSIEILSK